MNDYFVNIRSEKSFGIWISRCGRLSLEFYLLTNRYVEAVECAPKCANEFVYALPELFEETDKGSSDENIEKPIEYTMKYTC